MFIEPGPPTYLLAPEERNPEDLAWSWRPRRAPLEHRSWDSQLDYKHSALMEPGGIGCGLGRGAHPREVSRLPTVETFNPHWLARDTRSNRLVLGAELGGEEGFYLLRFDEQTGKLSFDPAFKGDGQIGYLSLKNQSWPHGPTGPAWGHAALFLPQ